MSERANDTASLDHERSGHLEPVSGETPDAVAAERGVDVSLPRGRSASAQNCDPALISYDPKEN